MNLTSFSVLYRCEHHDGAPHVFLHLTDQKPDAPNSKMNADNQQQKSQGDQRFVHGCQQILVEAT